MENIQNFKATNDQINIIKNLLLNEIDKLLPSLLQKVIPIIAKQINETSINTSRSTVE